MKDRRLSLLVTFLELGCALSLSTCPTANHVESLQAARFMGDWYQFASAGDLFGHELEKNVMMNFTQDKDSEHITITTNRITFKGMIRRRTQLIWKATLEQPSKRDGRILSSGKLNLNVTVPAVGETGLDLLVVNTDYVSCAILSACKVINNKAMLAIWILTRKKILNNMEMGTILAFIDASLEKNKLDHIEFKLTNKDHYPVVSKNTSKGINNSAKPKDSPKDTHSNANSKSSPKDIYSNVTSKSSPGDTHSNVTSKSSPKDMHGNVDSNSHKGTFSNVNSKISPEDIKINVNSKSSTKNIHSNVNYKTRPEDTHVNFKSSLENMQRNVKSKSSIEEPYNSLKSSDNSEVTSANNKYSSETQRGNSQPSLEQKGVEEQNHKGSLSCCTNHLGCVHNCLDQDNSLTEDNVDSYIPYEYNYECSSANNCLKNVCCEIPGCSSRETKNGEENDLECYGLKNVCCGIPGCSLKENKNQRHNEAESYGLKNICSGISGCSSSEKKNGEDNNLESYCLKNVCCGIPGCSSRENKNQHHNEAESYGSYYA